MPEFYHQYNSQPERCSDTAKKNPAVTLWFKVLLNTFILQQENHYLIAL